MFSPKMEPGPRSAVDGGARAARPADRWGGRPTSALLAAVFVPLTLLFTYPIWTAPGRVLNELADARLNTWTLAWDAHALITDPAGLFDANSFYPSKNTLAFSENLLGSALLVAPINWAGHPILAYNLVFLSSFLLTGIGTTLWVRHLTGSLRAGLFAAIIWTFAPVKFDHLPHLQLLTGQWIPFALLCCGRYVETGRSRYAYATAGFAGLQFATGVNYGLFLLPVLACYGLLLWLVLPGAMRPHRRRLARDAVAAAAILAFVVVPLALPYVAASRDYGFERNYAEIISFSAQPKAFLSPGWPSQTPHMRWLHETFWAPEANFFPGVLVSLLTLAGLLTAVALGGRALRADVWEPETGSASRVEGTASSRFVAARRRAAIGLAAAAAALWVLHFVALIVARWWSRPPAWDLLIFANQALSPALWLPLAAALAVALLPTARLAGRAARDAGYLIVVAYLALLTYLLAMGPEIRAWNFSLGAGPYGLLYEWLRPYQGIRAVARFGLLWALFSAALAGFVYAVFLEGRVVGWRQPRSTAPSARRNAVAWAVLGAFVAVVVWEYRVWPLPHQEADPREDPAYEWIAEQPGDFAVVHVPLQPGRQPWRETGYLLGSTLHWRPLVNGYSGFFPDDYRRLVDETPLSSAFFRRLREEFPVRYVIVHPEFLSSNEQRADLERLISGSADAQLVTDLGGTLVFTLRRDRESGPGLRRRYEADQLADKTGIRFLARISGSSTAEEAVLVAGWEGGPQQGIVLERSWRGFEFSLPVDHARMLAGQLGTFVAQPLASLRLAGAGPPVVASLIVDLQDGGAGVGAGDRWFAEAEAASFHVVVLEQYGTGARDRRVFAPTDEGARRMHAFLGGVAADALIAVTIGFDDWQELPEPMVRALALIGARPPAEDPVHKLVVLGWRGAAPGQALQTVGNKRAFIRIEAPAVELEVRGISIYE